MASGSLLTKIGKAVEEFEKIGLCHGGSPKLYGAQPLGCNPIASAVEAGNDLIRPVKKPETIAKSLAIGNPADGPYAAAAIRASGGGAAAVSDENRLRDDGFETPVLFSPPPRSRLDRDGQRECGTWRP